MKFNRLLLCLVPIGFLVSSCSSGSVSTTTTVAEPPQNVYGYEIEPRADLRDANLAGATMPDTWRRNR